MHINLDEIRSLDARAVALCGNVVDLVRPPDLDRPTPCAGWTVADLLGHLIAQHHGFAAAAAGHGADQSQWRIQPLGDDPAGRYREAAARVLSAFGGVDDPAQEFTLPDFGPTPVPARSGITAHAVDYLVHAWDVATALERPFAPDTDLVEALLPIVLSLPDDERRTEPGSPFAPALPATPDARPMDRILRAVGRNP